MSTITRKNPTSSRRLGRALPTVFGALLLVACGRASAPVPTRGDAPVQLRALSEYLPPSGLRSAFHIRPRALLADARLGPELRELLPEERLRAFQSTTGIDLGALEEAWIAEYELGWIYLAPFEHAEQAGARFLEHAESQRAQKRWASNLASYSVIRSNVPHGLVVQQGGFTAVTEQDLSLGRLVVARALGRLDHIPPALSRAGFELLPPRPTALFAVYWRGDAGESGGAVLVGRASIEHQEAPPAPLLVRLSIVLASDDEPTQAFRSYLAALLERPELRALWSRTTPEGEACVPAGDAWLCEAGAPLDAHTARVQFGALLQGGLDAF